MHYVAKMMDDPRPDTLDGLRDKINELRRMSQRPEWADFELTYEVGKFGHAHVAIGVGYSFIVELDSQTVVIDDPRLPFRVEGNVKEARLGRLYFDARPMVDREVLNAVLWEQVGAVRESRDALDKLTPAFMEASTPEELDAAREEMGRRFALADEKSDAVVEKYKKLPAAEIVQKDLRSLPFASLVKQWAAVAREYQVACLQRRQNGEEVDSNIFRDLLLYSGDEEALRATREAVARFAARRPYRRASTNEESEDVLRQVVEAYKDAVERGVRAPRAAVAERLSYHPAHVGRLLSKARRRGLLPPAKPRGRPARKNKSGGDGISAE